MLKYGIADIDVLANARYRLRDEIETKIQEYRESERLTAFQQFLMPDSKLTVDDAFSIDFKERGYEPGWLYKGHYKFQKHYFGDRPGELNYTSSAGGLTEEFKCAQFIDSMPEIKYWVRNLSRRNTSFRLQTSKDWFYPDFVCQLNDGRVLVVEYKGEYIYGSPDSDEKKTIGELWASRSKGKCLFVMPTEKNYSLISDVVKKSI
jgi:type III restriction enzyme